MTHPENSNPPQHPAPHGFGTPVMSAAPSRPLSAIGGGVTAIASGLLALLTIAVPWVEIVFGSFSLSELAEDGIGGTVSESAAAAMFFYLLAGVAGVGCGIVGIAANKRIAIIIAALGVLGSGVATSLATLIGFAGGALLLAAVSRLPK